MAGKNEELEKINSPREQQFRIYLAVSDNSQLPCPRIEGELAWVEESGSVSWSQSVTIKTEEDSNETQDSWESKSDGGKKGMYEEVFR